MRSTLPSVVSKTVIDAPLRDDCPAASTPPGAAAYRNWPSALTAIEVKSAVGCQWPRTSSVEASKTIDAGRTSWCGSDDAHDTDGVDPAAVGRGDDAGVEEGLRHGRRREPATEVTAEARETTEADRRPRRPTRAIAVSIVPVFRSMRPSVRAIGPQTNSESPHAHGEVATVGAAADRPACPGRHRGVPSRAIRWNTSRPDTFVAQDVVEVVVDQGPGSNSPHAPASVDPAAPSRPTLAAVEGRGPVIGARRRGAGRRIVDVPEARHEDRAAVRRQRRRGRDTDDRPIGLDVRGSRPGREPSRRLRRWRCRRRRGRPSSPRRRGPTSRRRQTDRRPRRTSPRRRAVTVDSAPAPDPARRSGCGSRERSPARTVRIDRLEGDPSTRRTIRAHDGPVDADAQPPAARPGDDRWSDPSGDR